MNVENHLQHIGKYFYISFNGKQILTIDSSGLKQHMHIHKTIKPYTCEVNFFLGIK